MLCSQCNAEIADDSAICPYCDAILDPSFLNLDPTTDPVSERLAPDETKPGGATEVPTGDNAPAVPPAPAIGASPTDKTDGTSILEMDPEQHKETRVVAITDLPNRRGPNAPTSSETAATSGAEGQADDIWGQVALAFRRLRSMEKIALFCLLALFVCAFLPWFHVRGEGFVSGIERRGGMTAVLSFLAIVTFWVRVNLRLVLLVLLQLGFVVGAGLFAGYALINPGSATLSFGIYLTLFSGIAAAVMSLVAAVKG